MHKEQFKNLLKILMAPLFLFGLYLLVFVLWRAFRLPTDEQLIEITKHWFTNFGLLVVFISGIIEGTLILGQYFPGGLVIFLGVISAGKDIAKIVEVVAIVCVSFFIGYSIDYAMGKYG